MLQSKPSVLWPAALPSLFEFAASPAAGYQDRAVLACGRMLNGHANAQLSIVSLDIVS